MQCPDCNQTLHNAARYCGCGWKRDNPFNKPDAIVDCAHRGCNSPAMCKVEATNLCDFHYGHHFRDEANANLDKYGLARMPDETPAEHVLRMRSFVKNGFKSISKTTTIAPEQAEEAKNSAILRPT